MDEHRDQLDESAPERDSHDNTCARSVGPPKNLRQNEFTLALFLIISQCLCLPFGVIVYILFIRPIVTVASLSVDVITILVACIVACLIGMQILFTRRLWK